MESRPSASYSETDTGCPTRLELLDWATGCLEEARRSAPRRTAEWLLTELLDCNRAELYAHAEDGVGVDLARRFEEMVGRRIEGEPLQHILGYASFYGLEFAVSPAVMVPRPETELVVDRALACLDGVADPRVLDVGTGSGCIALAIKSERPDAEVYGVDVSNEALEVARSNAERLELDGTFLEADLLADRIPDRLPRHVDLVVSNPPYIPEEEADSLPEVVRAYDPDLALFSGPDPIRYYRALATWVQTLARPRGWFVVEVHAEYVSDVCAELREAGLADVQTETDLNGRPRIAWGRNPAPDEEA